MRNILFIIIFLTSFSAVSGTIEITCKQNHTYNETNYTNIRKFIVEKDSVNAEFIHTTVGYKNKKKTTNSKEHISLKAKWLPTKIIFTIFNKDEQWHVSKYVIDRGSLRIYLENEILSETPMMRINRELGMKSEVKVGDKSRTSFKKPCALKVNKINNQF